MATPQPLENAFAQQPSSLEEPAPTQQLPDLEAMAAGLPSLDAPGSAPAVEPQTMPEGGQPPLPDLGAMAQSLSVEMGGEPQGFADSMQEQGREAWTRFRKCLCTTTFKS